ncbi:hypothetical protein SCHIN_v1c02540 [Spiroplasma chinense]|uniref:MOLPALP family lipoprotein n=1 Tax=Spiroplasma chinense TaxID=216932 RepID=A0A5B9Y398_9MOLU|nr:hypothetical protein [Spiroplasma chinense]QEH61451.1 hypothetical protein SCHIN_v1c02540 [Spiroplasma chinense]
MKKLISMLSSLSLITFSTLSVVSCAGDYNYDSLFVEKDKGNKGEYVDDSTVKVVNKLEKLTSKQMAANVNLGRAAHGTDWGDLDSSEKADIQNQVKNFISEQIEMDTSKFELEMDTSATFTIPKLIGMEGQSITQEAKVTTGNAGISLKYRSKTIYEGNIAWSIPEFDIIKDIANILNSNSGLNSIYDIKQIDIPLGTFDFSGVSITLTMGTITNFIGLVNTMLNSSLLGDVGVGVNNLMKMDLKGLAAAQPGSPVYDKFDSDFRNNLKMIFTGLESLLTSFGMSPIITLPSMGEGKEPIELKISELLDFNILDLVDFNVSDMNTEMDSNGAHITIKAEMLSRGKENTLRLIDILSNVAPNVVHLVSKFLNPDTYNPDLGGSGNILFLLLQDLITEMSPELETINNKNNDDNASAGAARSGLDSLLFNFLLGYNKVNRTREKANLYFYIDLTAFKDISLGTATIKLLHYNLEELLNLITLRPGEIVMKIINKLFDLEGESYLDLNKPFISGEDNMQFVDGNLISDTAFANLVDGAEYTTTGVVPEDAVKSYLEAYRDSFRNQIITQINDQINAMIPTLSLQDIINLNPNLMLQQLGIVPENLQTAEVKITKAHFVFEFWNDDAKEWDKITKGISDRTFAVYKSMKVRFFDVQFQVDLDTEANGKYTLLTRDDLTYDIIFDVADANKIGESSS